MTGGFLEAADRIGNRICRDAIWHGDRCNWLGWSFEPVKQGWTMAYRALKPGLYDGGIGIGLFLSHLHRQTGNPLQRDTALAAFRNAKAVIDNVPSPARQSVAQGLPGLAHALFEAAGALDDDALRRQAAATYETLATIEPSNECDLLAGSAGTIQTLLATGLSFGDRFVAKAVEHGENIIRRASVTEEGWCWQAPAQPGSKALLGYAHGTGGIGLALIELFQATAENRFRDAAIGAFTYERTHFNAKEGNWPDFRPFFRDPANPGQPLCALAWCHGAPGISLSRLRALHILKDDPEIARELHTALQTTVNGVLQPAPSGTVNYSLCHGQFGNAEPLLLAAGMIGQPALRTAAEQIARAAIAIYHAHDLPWPCGVMGGNETPGIMLGLAGIGHFFLRLHDPVQVPSILLIAPRPAAKGN